MPIHVEETIKIAAPPERVYPVVADVERWSHWTPSITSIKRLDSGPFAVGSRAEVRQPKLPKATWEVTKIEDGHGFDWTAGGIGITSAGGHWVEPTDDGGSLVRLSVESKGWMTYLIGWWMERITIKYVRMEAAGLKARVEGAA